MDYKKLSEITRKNMEKEMSEASIDKPQVGIFWYSPEEDELFGVVSEDADNVLLAGNSTLSKRHDQIWKKEHFRAISKDKKDSPFYSNDPYSIPRGRVFVFNSGFMVMVGKWIEHYPNVKDLIIEEFNLPENTEFRYDEHWDLGHGWSGNHMN